MVLREAYFGLFVAECYSVVTCSASSLYIHLWTRVGCFHVLILIQSTAVNIGVYISFQITAFSECMPRSGIAESHSSSVFSFLRKLPAVLYSGYTNLHSHEQCGRVPFPPYSLQSLLFVDFLMTALLSWVRWYLLVVLTRFSLTFSSVKHLFVCLLALWMPSLEKYLFRSAHLLIEFFSLLMLSSVSCLYILEINSLWVALFANIFFHSVDCHLFCLWFPLLCYAMLSHFSRVWPCVTP